ncbi:MAG: hypothetical protein ABSF45_08505 [Terriglobia bacterium]|jgi:hypothetical protein
MKCSFFILAAVLIATPPAPDQNKKPWTDWFPASNTHSRNKPEDQHERTDFSYRWRLSDICSGKDCSIKLQLRNNSDRRESVNYTISVEQHNGQIALTKDHRNFDPNETQDIPIDSYGKELLGVKIE